ncbi:MAG: T9SS type A sorting domain-containing protein [Saprospiraceae bacterium]|uniref:T9SS type A sorting domain-containing protein n=1 Tax=Candidatus Defluviibacterium haderslevense TaxID=2981993 RepID=A0A9D7SAC4_9BACT|nr:T9SS type A sorting domain-containing protein [Candidatus Defluviibacterium haderslevense]
MKLFSQLVFLILVISSKLASQQWGDYTLIAPNNSTTAQLVDTDAVVVKTWNLNGSMTGYSSHLMPGGFLWRTVRYSPNSFAGGGQTGKVQKLAWDGTLLWDFVYSTTAYSMHHDICPMPNGNVLLISYEKRTAAEVSAAGSTFNGEMWPDKVVEVKPTGLTTGDVVWEWKVWDHLVQNTNASKANYQSSIVNHPELLNINYKPSMTNYLKVTHDAHWIPETAPNSGRLAGFNNQGISNTKSCVDQVNPPLNGYLYDITSGKAFDPSIYTYRHTANGYSSNMGSSQELPNGNLLVCLATAGTVYEINSTGATLWSKTYNGAIPQAFRYSKCQLENPAPPIPKIIQIGTSLNSLDAASYQWYLNGQAIKDEQSKSITPTKAGIYLVRTTNELGCVYQYSKGFKIEEIKSLGADVIISSDSICMGDSTLISAIIKNGSSSTSLTWESNPPGFNSTQTTINVAPLTSTEYILKIKDGSNEYSSSHSIVVFPAPTKPTISRSTNDLMSTSATNYQWFLDGTTISGATEQILTASQNGIYQVQIRDSNGCLSEISDGFTFELTQTNDVSELDWQIYPNPVKQVLKIHAPSLDQQNYQINIFNAVGKLIWSDQNTHALDVSHLSNGLYLIQLSTQQTKSIHKFILIK